MNDIYTKRDIEFQYSETQLEESDNLRMYIQKIKMILFTERGDTIDPDFGINLKRLLFKKNLTNFQIEQELKSQISKYCSEFDTTTTKVIAKFYNRGNHDECEITISINDFNIITLKTN